MNLDFLSFFVRIVQKTETFFFLFSIIKNNKRSSDVKQQQTTKQQLPNTHTHTHIAKQSKPGSKPTMWQILYIYPQQTNVTSNT